MLPLAERLRPKTLNEYIGQQHLVGEGAILRQMLDRGTLSSFILWGPPGVGKQLWRVLLRVSWNALFILCQL